MQIEDARPQIAAAIESLRACNLRYGLMDLRVADVPTFFAAAEQPGRKLSLAEKTTLVDQAILLIDQFYAHLPFKRARYAVNPVQRLRLIRAQLSDGLSEFQFHAQMVAALACLRDAHTFYGLPAPFRDALAFLPFRLDFYFDQDQPRFLVTEVLESFDHPHFRPGAEVTFWNGMPVRSAIEREAELDPSGNESAQFARALNRLTARSLTFSLPRDEHWVTLVYHPAGGPAHPRGILLPWNVVSGGGFLPLTSRSDTSVYAPQVEQAQYRKLLWGREQLDLETSAVSIYGAPAAAEPPPGSTPLDETVVSRLPAVFFFQHSGSAPRPRMPEPSSLTDPAHPEKHFAYLAIRSFDGESGALVDECRRILTLLQQAAPDGLILDVRSNPGGSIQAAEQMLQMLTPNSIQTAGFHFVSTPLTQQIAAQITADPSFDPAALAEWQPWIDDLLASVASGSLLTTPRPLTAADTANAIGQVYQGPVLLLIDALSYSATDIFCGGFQDNQIGPVVGVDPNTGGGANRWLHTEFLDKTRGLTGFALEPLPHDATIGLAIRRSSRVGPRAGQPLEDTGVQADELYSQTRDDLLHHDRDLIRFACAKLGALPACPLRIDSAAPGGGVLQVKLTCGNLRRLEFLLDGRPQAAAEPASGDQTFSVPLAGLATPPRLLTVLGYRGASGGGAASLSADLAAAGIEVPAAAILTPSLTLAVSARLPLS